MQYLKKKGPTGIVVLNRRVFLKLAGGAFVSLSFGGLMGCGGSGGGTAGTSGSGSSLALKTYTATVKLPFGAASKLGPLTVQNGLNTKPVAANSSFTMVSQSSFPSIVSVVNSAGTAVYFGFLDPAVTANVIGAESTAVVLIYSMLGFFGFTTPNQSNLLKLIAADPHTTTLASVITNRTTTNPLALGQNDSQILQAVATACTGITGSTSSEISKRLNRSSGSAGTSTDAKLLAHPKNTAGTVTIDPIAELSGSEVFATTDNAGINAENFFRFEKNLYVFKTGHVDKSGNTIALPTPVQIGPMVVMEATAALSLSVTLNTITGGETPWLPTITAEVPLTLDSGFEQTLYDAIIIGPGTQVLAGATPPEFFESTKYSAMAEAWEESAKALLRKTVLLYVVAMCLEFAGLNIHGHGTFGLGQGILIDNLVDALDGIKDPGWQKGIDQCLELNIVEGIETLLTQIVTNADVGPQFWILVAGFAVAIGLTTVPEKVLEEASYEVLEAVTGVLHFIGAGLVLADLTNWSTQIVNSDIGVLYGVTLSSTAVTLSPLNPLVAAGATIPFNVTVLGLFLPTGSSLSLTWNLAGGDSGTYLTDGVNTSPNLLKTASQTVSVVTDTSQLKPMTLTVTANVISGSTINVLGSATTTVTIKGAPISITLIPTALSVKPGATSSAITAKTKALLGTVAGQGQLYWQAYPTSLGQLTTSGDTTSITNAFVAGSTQGTATVECRYIDNTTGSTLGSASMTVLIQQNPTIVFGELTCGGHTQDGRFYWGIWVQFKVVPHASSVEMNCYNFDDTAYWGTSVTGSGTYTASGGWNWSGGNDINADASSGGPPGSDGSLYMGLTGGGGPSSGNNANDVAGIAAYMQQRFGGMIVQATFTLSG